ncbi:MAG TPA: M23 family metallopeptidase [Flavobacteriales bacterium]
MHGERLRPILLAALITGLCQGLHAQADTSAIGGPEEIELDEEGAEEELMDEDAAVVDPVLALPAADIYKGWNTDAIFVKELLPKDTVRLRLAYADCDHHLPVRGGITSPFGPRRGRMHYGTDIKLQTGDTVACAFEGTVRISRYHKQYGHVVVVRHANGLETLYGHLSQRSVEPGDHVEAGGLIGLGGSTGRSTGSHLHFETRYLGSPIDPQQLFDLTQGALRADTFCIHPGVFAAAEKARAAAKASRYYRVRKGDTLSAISRRYGVPVSRLCRMNRISSRSTLRVGQRVRYR